MNAGMVVLRDGTPCITYDTVLPHPIWYVEFSHEDYQLTLVYDTKDKGGAHEGYKFPYPVDHAFVALMKERESVAIAKIDKNAMVEFKMYSVVFTN